MDNNELMKKNKEEFRVLIFKNESDEYYYDNSRLIYENRDESKEISFHDFADIIEKKYEINLELPVNELVEEASSKINKIGFECYATKEIRKITNFVINYRDSILAKEKEEGLEKKINDLFAALEEVRKIDPENDWNILCNDEILIHDNYVKTKRLGQRDY